MSVPFDGLLVPANKTPRYTCSAISARADGIDARTRVGDVQDGRIRLTLSGGAAGLLVARVFEGVSGVKRESVQVFHCSQDFERWWSVDPIRFSHPLLHDAVRRDAAELRDACWQDDPCELLAG